MTFPTSLTRGLALGLLLWLTGCFQDEKVLRLKPDGSGAFTETIMLSSALVAQMRAMAPEGATTTVGSGEVDESKLRLRATDLGAGVTFVSAEKVKNAFGEGYRATFAFTDINQLSVTTKPPAVGPQAEAADENTKPPMTFKFTKGSPATLVITMPEDEKPAGEAAAEPADPADPVEAAMQEAMLPMVMQMFKDTRMTMSIEFEGRVVDTNAKFHEGSRVTLLDVDFNKILADATQLKAMAKITNLDSPEGKAFLEKVPGIRVEQAKTIQVRFQ